MSSSSDEEDDLPPPLEDVSQELSKLGVKDASYKAIPETNTKKKDASRAPAVKKGLRKGFFDAPRRAPKKTSSSSSSTKKRDGEEDMVELKGKQNRNGGRGSRSQQKQVPEWMKIDPKSDASRMMQMKEKVVEAMKPTPDMMQNVMGNQDLMAGFDSPEVMMAVNEIAKNPENIKKYKDNPKVMAFYQNMAKTMAGRFEKLAEEEEEKKKREEATPPTQQNHHHHHHHQQKQQQGTTKESQSFQDKLNFNLSHQSEKTSAKDDFKPLIEEL